MSLPRGIDPPELTRMGANRAEAGAIARPHGILFDLGNTLLREDAFDVEAGTRHVLSFARNPRGLSAQDVCDLVTELYADLLERREASWIELTPFTVHRLIYEPHGITFERSFRDVELEFFRAATSFSLTPGIRDLLANLRSHELPLGVVSNATFSSQTLSWLVQEFGLRSFFEFVMSSADYIVRKPHPVIFLVAARKLGIRPEQT